MEDNLYFLMEYDLQLEDDLIPFEKWAYLIVVGNISTGRNIYNFWLRELGKTSLTLFWFWEGI